MTKHQIAYSHERMVICACGHVLDIYGTTDDIYKQWAKHLEETQKSFLCKIEEYLEEAEKNMNIWGSCGHEWISMTKLRELVNEEKNRERTN